MKFLRIWAVAALALTGAAAGIGELTLNNPTEGAELKPGQVVKITWRNRTTNPVDLWLKWDGRRKSLGEYGGETDGMTMWRVPADASGEYRIVIEEAGGLGSRSTVNVLVRGEAPVALEVYAAPNPFDVSVPQPLLTFAGAPIGSSAKVFDMEGREVIALESDPLQWDGRNEHGDLVSGGTYLFVVETQSGEKHTGKIAVVK